MAKSLETLLKGYPTFDQHIFDTHPHWAIIRELYDKNFINANRNHIGMPKKIHQIWLGGTLPKAYQGYADTWKRFNPEWEYRLWMDKDVKEVDIPRRDLFDSIKNLGQKSDFLRYHILNQYGGMYVDTDFECLKSFDTLAYADFLVGVGYRPVPLLYIGLIGSVPGHPVVKALTSAMKTVRGRNADEIFNTTGPHFFNNTFFKVVTKYMEGVVVLPTDYFYPFPGKFRFQSNGKDYIKDCSYAIHYWAVSWDK